MKNTLKYTLIMLLFFTACKEDRLTTTPPTGEYLVTADYEASRRFSLQRHMSQNSHKVPSGSTTVVLNPLNGIG